MLTRGVGRVFQIPSLRDIDIHFKPQHGETVDIKGSFSFQIPSLRDIDIHLVSGQCR